MRHHATLKSRLAALVVAALAFVAVTASTSPSVDATTTASSGTSWPASCPGPPDSLDQSTSQSGAVVQSLNGSIIGCFRVPDDRVSSLHVAWQAYVQLYSGATPPSISSTSPASSPDGEFTFSIAASRVRPQEHVEVSGHYVHGHRPANSSSAIICWDGCQSGLSEQGISLRWTSSTEFHATLVVPGAPWYFNDHGQPSVHPLTSGTYTVGIECIASSEGCALKSADAQVRVRLVAPTATATWCTAHVACGSLSLSTTHTTIGDVVVVRGRAPLANLIGRPFGYWLDLSATALGSQPVAFTRTGGADQYFANVAPKVLTVEPGATWASQRLSPITSSSWSSSSVVNPTPGSPLVAWCEPGVVVVTGGLHPLQIPTMSARRALASEHLSLAGSTNSTPCVSASVDPEAPQHIFAAFAAEASGVVPPFFLAGLYSTDGGATWRLVPSPPGRSDIDFSGFRVTGRNVQALFVGSPRSVATYPARTTVAVETTSNGAGSWTASTLGCPSTGPCTVFGPSTPGNCAMNPQPEAVLVGPTHGPPSGVAFTESRWVTTVNVCNSQQLAVTGSGLELLADPSSIYPLLASNDGGHTWYNVRLPVLAGLGEPGTPSGSLVLATNGALVASVQTSNGRQRLFLLRPSASSWCEVQGVLNVGSSQLVSSLRTSGADLLWGQNQNTTSGTSQIVTRHIVAVNDLHC
ncbi:MAG: hypothetical protein PXZ08_07560 [Actinomycetota bacterium]|nr:hypothetical protein [Actinomycetota bacterium]